MDIADFNALRPVVDQLASVRGSRTLLADATISNIALSTNFTCSTTDAGNTGSPQVGPFTTADATVIAAYSAFLEALDTSMTAALTAAGVTS